MAQDDDGFLTRFAKTFETPGPVPASEFVPEGDMSGRLHSVAASALNDGLNNTYFIGTFGGEIQVTRTPALLERIREIYALDYLRGLSKTEEFGKALANGGKAKIEGVVGVVKDPFGTIANIPKGASRFFGRIGEGLKGGKSELGDGGLKGLTGVSKAKAQLAGKLGINPYTTNQELQNELTGVARAIAGGGLALNIATGAIGGPAGEVITGLSRKGLLIVPVSLDYGIWAERTARRTEDFANLAGSKPEIKVLALLTDGRLSARLCEELKSRNIGYRMDALR